MDNLLDLAKETIRIEIESLQSGMDSIDDNFLNIISEIAHMQPGGRLVVMGMGKSGHIGNKIAATLASTGTPSFFVHPAEAGHGDLGMISLNDMVLAISQSGKSEEILKLVPFFKRRGIKMISMTGDLSSPMAEVSDFVISTKVIKEACPLGLAPTSSTTLTLALGDALAVCLLKRKGFSPDDFAITHPNGTLGRKLLITLNDVMSQIEQTPYVYPNATIKDAIFTISSKGLGFVVIVSESMMPIGIFTDGDLRRCFDKGLDLLSTSISEVMTKSFSMIESSKLCVEAVKIMSDKKITMLPVIDKQGKLNGAINMRQLLQAGVV
jgi:arabinose-5-phosphate isomerase